MQQRSAAFYQQSPYFFAFSAFGNSGKKLKRVGERSVPAARYLRARFRKGVLPIKNVSLGGVPSVLVAGLRACDREEVANSRGEAPLLAAGIPDATGCRREGSSPRGLRLRPRGTGLPGQLVPTRPGGAPSPTPQRGPEEGSGEPETTEGGAERNRSPTGSE